MSRFDDVRAAGDRRGAFTVGLAQLEPCEELAGLIERADLAMYEVRGRAVQRRARDSH